MFLFSNLLLAIAQVLDAILRLYTFILLGRVIVSWVNADPYNPIVRFLYNATEPLLYRVRRLMPVVLGGIDLSPLLVFFGIEFIRAFLVRSLYDLAVRL
ncbi:MAG TPA: YggT family protein [Terriglobales bacterium]|nr:YggT family protein [Terriglobales bacterium]